VNIGTHADTRKERCKFTSHADTNNHRSVFTSLLRLNFIHLLTSHTNLSTLSCPRRCHASAALPRSKKIPLPIEEEVGWAPGTVWTFRRRKKLVSYIYRQSNHCSSVINQWSNLVLRLRPLCRTEIMIVVFWYRFKSKGSGSQDSRGSNVSRP
jgi:hypothetical protein